MNKALCIAVDSYCDPSIAPLKFAASDAMAMGALLADRYGYAVTFAVQPTASDLFATFARCLGELKPGDKLVTYFAGHAVSADQDLLLLASDARPALLDDASVKAVPGMVSLRALMQTARQRALQHLMVFDCCRSPVQTRDGISRGDFTRRPARSAQDAPAGVVWRRVTVRTDAAAATVLTAADSIGSRSIELVKRGRGLFTWALMQLLDVAPAQAQQMQVDSDFLARLVAVIKEELTACALEILEPEVRPGLVGPDFRFH